MTANQPTTIMALDFGERRLGVALASSVARLASPFTTLENSPDTFKELQTIIKDNNVSAVVVGRPRGLNGQSTPQTKATEEFAAKLQKFTSSPVSLQDEAVTSRQATAELKAKGKPYIKGDIDALAAVYILEDYLHERETSHVQA